MFDAKKLMHSAQPLDALLKFLGGPPLHCLDIAARAKTPSGAGDDDRTDAGVAAQALQRLVEAL